MGWNTNSLGVVVDKTMNADFVAMKAAGISFVVMEAGLGFDASPALADQMQKAKDAGLPVIAQWTPYPAYDGYTFDGIAQAQIAEAQKALANKSYYAFVVSMERYWTGLDLENGQPIRQATETAIDHVASEFAHSFTKMLAPLSHPVLIRTNDAFVQKYSPPMGTGWTDKFGFFLADWRYRTRDAQGAYTVYTPYKTERTPVPTVAELRAAMPPDGSKNPLIPGNAPQLKFWEYSGNRYVLPWIKGWDNSEKRVKVLLFNGDEAACYSYLGFSAAQPPPVDPGDPGNEPGDPGGTGNPSDTGSQQLERIIELLDAIQKDISSILRVFQKIFK